MRGAILNTAERSQKTVRTCRAARCLGGLGRCRRLPLNIRGVLVRKFIDSSGQHIHVVHAAVHEHLRRLPALSLVVTAYDDQRLRFVPEPVDLRMHLISPQQHIWERACLQDVVLVEIVQFSHIQDEVRLVIHRSCCVRIRYYFQTVVPSLRYTFILVNFVLVEQLEQLVLIDAKEDFIAAF